MSKKTGRSARAIQAQRNSLAGERKSAARPLVNLETSSLATERPAGTTVTDDEVAEEVVEETTAVAPTVNLPPRPASPTTSRTRAYYARRTTAPAARQHILSREEEYRFIRSDLISVTVLTILMLVILIVLTFIIGR